ncbi:MAG: hypothetical protein ACLTW6_12560 [Enterobacter sp.]
MNIPNKISETPYQREKFAAFQVNAKKSPPNKKSNTVSKLVYRVMLNNIIEKRNWLSQLNDIS